ncbi:hypothetical protein BRD14_04175 [Halobacteriales archaeon SW_5_68_122]|nr:MAG: hypothetical protein BRD14_04175 [Halobacteriales archaeon SW_5_68_122]
METFTDVATAAYCPRKLYYRRRADDHDAPDEIESVRELAFRYPDLLSSETDLAAEPIAVTPTQYRSNLGRAKARLDCWNRLIDPADRDVLLEGKDCRGIAHKVLETPPRPVVVLAGAPPERGVYESQSVRATAAAKALAWERERPVETALVEYPAHGEIRPCEYREECGTRTRSLRSRLSL